MLAFIHPVRFFRGDVLVQEAACIIRSNVKAGEVGGNPGVLVQAILEGLEIGVETVVPPCLAVQNDTPKRILKHALIGRKQQLWEGSSTYLVCQDK